MTWTRELWETAGLLLPAPVWLWSHTSGRRYVNLVRCPGHVSRGCCACAGGQKVMLVLNTKLEYSSTEGWSVTGNQHSNLDHRNSPVGCLHGVHSYNTFLCRPQLQLTTMCRLHTISKPQYTAFLLSVILMRLYWHSKENGGYPWVRSISNNLENMREACRKCVTFQIKLQIR